MPFEEVIADVSGGNVKTPQGEFLQEGQFAIVDQGKELISGYANEEKRLCHADLPVIIFGDHTRCFKYVDFPFCMGADGVKVLRPKIDTNVKYLYYYLRQLHITNAGYSRHFKYLKQSEVVLPPLDEQKRIADILDRAEALQAKRQTALDQFDELTEAIFMDMFGDPVINPMGWNTKKLEKLCVKILGGGTPSKSRPEYYEGNIPWVTPKDMKQDYIQDSIDHISAQAVEESSTKLIPPNSLLMVIRSGILKKKLPVAINICEVTINQDMKGFIFDNRLTNSYFMLYFFKIYQRDLLNRVRSVTADNLEFNQIKDINVILPPIESQQEFVKIVEHLERVRSSQEKSLLEINNLFDSLAHEAFTGKLFSHQFFEQEIENGVKI